ncbi:hypothetical protein [Pseudomonas sp. BN411]|uniref:hypothetical protein n=1 Tax=Pseudomonas sp. BN411 TaxID=2567887 RepID=UPI00245700F2|nr:hypothetical protein [Pseudomonas sp. BN411]MDH4564460.1 hypothetical protein [Pseudomonas sp. BN411]
MAEPYRRNLSDQRQGKSVTWLELEMKPPGEKPGGWWKKAWTGFRELAGCQAKTAEEVQFTNAK